MVMDCEAQTLYAFGGEVYTPGETGVRYGAMYSYSVQTGKWRKLLYVTTICHF
jgi:muskelin